MIKRVIEPVIAARFFKRKALLIFGPRQSGKSTLVESLLAGKEFLYLNGDYIDVREQLSDMTQGKLNAIAANHKIIFIDEAQRVPDIGLTLKIMVDQLKDVQVIATGSSAFELSGKVNEPLTGRKYEFMLFPLSFGEMVAHHGFWQEKQMLEWRMIYGYYPGVVTNPGDEKELVKSLTGSYLYKDLLMLEQLQKPILLDKLLKALALQVGSEVNYIELAQTIGANKQTVERYIDLLEKTFVVFVLPALTRNARNEIKKGKKIYFYDCGVRNAIINNFSPLSSRTDTGALWENFVIAERMKFLRYNNTDAKMYFWRTTQQQEIDLIEEYQQEFSAYEFKWGKTGKVRFPQTFTENYPGSKTMVVSPDNIEDFLLPQG